MTVKKKVKVTLLNDGITKKGGLHVTGTNFRRKKIKKYIPFLIPPTNSLQLTTLIEIHSTNGMDVRHLFKFWVQSSRGLTLPFNLSEVDKINDQAGIGVVSIQ